MKTTLRLERSLPKLVSLVHFPISLACLTLIMMCGTTNSRAQNPEQMIIGNKYKIVLTNGVAYERIIQVNQDKYCILKVGNRTLKINYKYIYEITPADPAELLTINPIDTTPIKHFYLNAGTKVITFCPLFNGSLGVRINKNIGFELEAFGLTSLLYSIGGYGVNLTSGNNTNIIVIGTGKLIAEVIFLEGERSNYFKLGYTRFSKSRSWYGGLDFICKSGGCVAAVNLGHSF